MSIKLKSINVKGNTVNYDFEASEGLEKYFTGKPFAIEYPENIEAVPKAILAVPFVANVLPIIWLSDSKLFIEELDESFYNCIPNVKDGYRIMFPEANFVGQIHVNKIVACDRQADENKCAMFYSGGLDSVNTFVKHFEEKPDLLSIWGSDIKFENRGGGIWFTNAFLLRRKSTG